MRTSSSRPCEAPERIARTHSSPLTGILAIAAMVAVPLTLPARGDQNPADSHGESVSGTQKPATANAVISDPVEFGAYQAAITRDDPRSRATALEDFLRTYPQSSAGVSAREQLVAAYQQLAAQTPSNSGSGQPNAVPAPSTATHKAAPHAGVHRSASAKPSPATPPPAAPVPAVPVAPPPPDWPINDRSMAATVVWDSQGLRITADNSSLQQILSEVSTDTGARVEGLNGDQRVFGVYGPGPARQVLSELLDGTGYNVLMFGDQGEGTPREIVLSTPPAGPAPTGNNRNNLASEEEYEPEPQPEPPPPEPVVDQPPATSPGAQPPSAPPVRTPQQMYQEMQMRQQQMQQQGIPPQPNIPQQN